MNEKKSKIMKIERIKKAIAEFAVCTRLGEMNFENLGALVTNKCEEAREIDARLSKGKRIAGIMNYPPRAKQDNEI